MKITQITEHFVNLNTPAEKEPYKDQVWDILQTSYAKVGGFKSAVSVDELVNTPGLWKLSRRNGKIVAVNLYRDAHGRKSIASGTDGSIEGKQDYFAIKNDDNTFKRAWAEVSGPVERMLANSGVMQIPNKFASVLTGKEILDLDPDGVHYTRLIQGEPHKKIMFGFVKMTPELKQKLDTAGIALHDLPTSK